MKTKLLKKLRELARKHVYFQCTNKTHCSSKFVVIAVENKCLTFSIYFPYGKSFVSDCYTEYTISKHGMAVPIGVKQDGFLHLEDCEYLAKEFTLDSEEAMKTLSYFRRRLISEIIYKMRIDRKYEKR